MRATYIDGISRNSEKDEARAYLAALNTPMQTGIGIRALPDSHRVNPGADRRGSVIATVAAPWLRAGFTGLPKHVRERDGDGSIIDYAVNVDPVPPVAHDPGPELDGEGDPAPADGGDGDDPGARHVPASHRHTPAPADNGGHMLIGLLVLAAVFYFVTRG